MEKNFLKSMTLWVNLLVLIGTWFGVKELTPELSQEIVVTIVAAVNIALRFKTKSAITLT